MARRYRAFISYSWADKEWGEWVHHALETYRTPRALIGSDGALGAIPERLHPIFKDREEEAAGHGITAAIETALADSEFLVVVCSPNSAKSKWVNREIAWFKTHRDKTRILALVVEGEPLASFKGDDANECFPKALLYEVDGDLQPTDRAEDPPLAADARKEGDGKRGAKLKLAAALLGAGLDALVRRDERRRAIRRRIVMAGMAASIAVLGVLTVYAFNQRNAAILARNDAVASKKDAEFQRDEAEGLVEFMLTDLRKRLDAVGRLDILDSVGERALQYYSKQDVQRLDPDALGRRSRAQLLVGEVDNTRGDLDAALKAYKEAASTTEELLRRDPNNAQRIFDHAQSVFWVGYIAWQRGDAATAKKYFTQYKDYADQLVAIDPENDDWQMEEKYSLTNLGTLELDQGNAAGAEDHFRHALDISLALLAKKPGDSKRIFTAGQAHAWLAVAMVQELNFEGAKNQRLLEIALYQKAAADAPGDIAYLEPQAPAFRNLATIELYQGDLQAAKSYIMRGQSVSGALTDRDPSNTLWQEFAGRDAMLEGQINLFHGELGMARVALNKAVHIGNMLVSTKSDTVAWQRDTLSKAEILLARVAGKSGDKQEAARLAQKALRELQKLSSENDGDIKAIENKTAAIEVLVEIGMRPPQRWAEIVSMLAPIGEHAPPVAQARYAHALAALGRKEDARPIALRLLAAGYRHPDFIRLLNEHPTLVAER